MAEYIKVLPDELPDEIELNMSGFSSNQQIELEDMLNADFEKIMESGGASLIDDDGKKRRGGEINRAIIWVGLKGHYPDLTIEEAGDVPLVSLFGSKDEPDGEPSATG